MKKIIEKWYVGVIFIPILLTYFTNYFTLPKIISSWKNAIIFSLISLVIILFFEVYLLTKRNKELIEKPKDSDKRIVNKLLNILDLKMFHEEIYLQQSWYGYKREAIGKIIDFNFEVDLIENRLVDKRLEILMNKFKKATEAFTNYGGSHLYDSDHKDYYVPHKTTEEARKKAEIEMNYLDSLSKEAFENLEEMINYLKSKEYI